MTTPALLRLRERFPEAHIALLTPEKLRQLWLEHPSLNAVHAFAAGERPWSVARRLRAERFELALVLPNSPRSALEAWLARIPRRIGYARTWRNWLLTQPVGQQPGIVTMRKRSTREINRLIRLGSDGTVVSGKASDPASRFTFHVSSPAIAASHHTRHYLHLVAAVGANPALVSPSLAVTAEEIRSAAAKFRLDIGAMAGRPVLGLNPGAEYGPAKRWPAERFIAVAREVQQRTGCAWLILGGGGDVPLAEKIRAALETPQSAVQNLAGKTSLRELMALLKRCRVLLTNDTGPMHLAAALATPVVAPFGSTSPELTAPGMPGDPRHHLFKSEARCAPCFQRACPIDFRCMMGIGVERVIEAVIEAGALAP